MYAIIVNASEVSYGFLMSDECEMTITITVMGILTHTF